MRGNGDLRSQAERAAELSRDWMVHANCRGVDPDLFFPVIGEELRPARRVCSECAVREECLEYALTVGERFGVWGGLSERERRKERRRRTAGELEEARKRVEREAAARYQRRTRTTTRAARVTDPVGDGPAGVLDVLYILERGGRAQ